MQLPLLTGHDAIGFIQLRPRVSDATTAVGSYTSCAVSFTLGFTLITGGAVRSWIYCAVGVGARAITRLTLKGDHVCACLLDIFSHAPGGIGVFEATILLALPNVPKEQILGSLLLFRLCYLPLPFVAALLLLAGREILMRRQVLEIDMQRADRSEAGVAEGSHDDRTGR